MAKRKGNSTKTKASKIAKVDDSKEENEEKVVESENNNDNVVVTAESKEEKLENFKKKLGMVKDDSDNKDWVDGDGYVLYNPSGSKPSTKIAAFDLDDTLIISKSGKKFAESWDDWKFMFDEIPGKLKLLENDGYKIVVFSNQGGIEKGKLKLKDMKRKIVCITEKLNLKIQVFLSITYNSVCRKPNRGMFDLLIEHYNANIEINLEESFYVGDAAGRPAEWAPKKKKDFSCSDRLFAKNSHLKFHTPEEYFLGEKEAPFVMPLFNPGDVIKHGSETLLKHDGKDKTTADLKDLLLKDSSEQSLVIMVGCPGSGKSTFCEKYLTPLGFEIINRDTLKTWQKCVAHAKSLIQDKKNVVIDNTNPDSKTRERYVSLATECGVKRIICCIMDVSEEQCKHNELFRQLTAISHDKISEIVFRQFSSRYQEPTTDEKFTEIVKISPGLAFENDQHKNMYSRYLVG